jgi:hypothetical protein
MYTSLPLIDSLITTLPSPLENLTSSTEIKCEFLWRVKESFSSMGFEISLHDFNAMIAKSPYCNLILS